MAEKNIPKISTGYTNIYGAHYDMVREIAYRQGELCLRLGKYITETKYDVEQWLGSSFERSNGVYIYQSYDNPFIGYRIYKTFAEPGFNGYRDDLLIQRLRERQQQVSLSKLPTGVVTLDGRIIGQEIPYFQDKITLGQYIKENPNINPFEIYQNILDILHELYQNGIAYIDNHPNNFMINPKDNTQIDIIDFDETYVKFDDYSLDTKRRLLNNYRVMIDNLNNVLGIYNITDKFITSPSFKETYEGLNYMSKTLKRVKP